MTVYSQKEIQWKIVSLGRKNRQKSFARTCLMPLSIFRRKSKGKKRGGDIRTESQGNGEGVRVVCKWNCTSLWKVLLQPSCKPPSGSRRVLWGVPRAFSSPGWRAPALPACLHMRDVPAVINSGALCSVFSNWISCVWSPRAGHGASGGVSQEQSRAAESPPSTC